MEPKVQYEQVLQQRGKQLRLEIREALLRADAERHALLAEQVHDTRDPSVLQALTEVGAADIARDAQELLDVESSLVRLHSGQYGKCTDCGAMIATARLVAYPSAKRCLTCQQRHEEQRPG
jgi:RNA polymerase-binding transcription factor DksA